MTKVYKIRHGVVKVGTEVIPLPLSSRIQGQEKKVLLYTMQY